MSVDTRWKEHLRHARYGDQVINRAMRKYGVDKFYIETLEICSVDVLDEREMYYIDLFDSTDKSKGYNVSIGGNTPRFKRKALSISDLVNLYVNERFTLEKLGIKYGVSRQIIVTELRNAGITIRSNAEAHDKVSRIDVEVLKDALSKTKSLRQAAKYAGIAYPTFRKACILNNVEYNSSKSIRHSDKRE